MVKSIAENADIFFLLIIEVFLGLWLPYSLVLKMKYITLLPAQP